METAKQPYELLVRWDQSGKLSGAHVLWRYVTRGDDGNIVAEGVSNAEEVNVGQGKGFPLADILSETETAALISRDAALAQVATLASEKAALDRSNAALADRVAALEAKAV